MSTKRRSKLAKSILGLIGISGGISIFFYGFLRFMTQAIVEIYCEKGNILMSDIQYEMTDYWLGRVCLLTAVILFLFLCFFLTGQKLLYIREIIHGVDALREKDMDYEVPVEGEDELSLLAESINYLAKSQRELKEKEEALKEEKENFIRELSHDIRTPLTSVLAMSEYLIDKEDIILDEVKDYILLVRNKSVQMKELTDRLLNETQRNLVFVENGRLLFEQLIDEWQELLEDDFDCQVEMSDCPVFSGEFDITELRRVFDNLASNVAKYADSSEKVVLKVDLEDGHLVISQSNHVAMKDSDSSESYGIGLQSIERIAKIYHGTMKVECEEREFKVIVKFRIIQK